MKEGVDPDVEKAKKEDLKKKQTIFNVDPNSKVESPKRPDQKKTAAINDPKKQAELSRRQEAYKYATSTSNSNNRIGERNQKSAKDKDCIIY